MASYCKQCSIEIWGEDYGDLALNKSCDEYKNDDNYCYLELCEGCGWILVDKDGLCIDEECEEHGKQH